VPSDLCNKKAQPDQWASGVAYVLILVTVSQCLLSGELRANVLTHGLSSARDPNRTLTCDIIGIRFCLVRPPGQQAFDDARRDVHEETQASGRGDHVRIDMGRSRQGLRISRSSRRFFSSTAHGRMLQAGTASSISCSKTVTPSEPYRILCADSPQTLPSSQRISNPLPDPLFW
jgi:hypothetical protein